LKKRLLDRMAISILKIGIWESDLLYPK